MPLGAEIVVVEILAAVVVEPERVVADEERACRVVGHGILRHDVAHIVVGACVVSFLEDDLQEAVARRGFRREDDAVILDFFQRLFRHEEDARDLLVRAHADVGQDHKAFVALCIDDG